MTASEQARGWPEDIDEPNQMMDTIMPSVYATSGSLTIRHAANLGLLSYAGTRTAATRRFPFRPLLVPAIPPTGAFGSLRRRLWCYPNFRISDIVCINRDGTTQEGLPMSRREKCLAREMRRLCGKL